MDDPSDFYSLEARFQVGDLVTFTGYHYTPDFYYVDEDDYNLGVVMAVHTRTYYAPIYTVHWFKERKVTEVIQDHLSMVIKKS
jgi:hypothetical protein|tara:strand:- start:542 stop:790 length:249 start_codon:yes stop_codon:yes gene_type:complete